MNCSRRSTGLPRLCWGCGRRRERVHETPLPSPSTDAGAGRRGHLEDGRRLWFSLVHLFLKKPS